MTTSFGDAPTNQKDNVRENGQNKEPENQTDKERCNRNGINDKCARKACVNVQKNEVHQA